MLWTRSGAMMTAMRKKPKEPNADIDHLREQAQRCYRLAREVMDLDVRRQLEELGREFEQKATALEHKPPSKSER